MSLIDKLLQKDRAALASKPTTEVEIERLSELIGEPCMVKLQALGTKQMRELREIHTREEWKEVKVNGKTTKQKVEVVDSYMLGLDAIVEASLDPNFRDSRLREKFGTEVPTDIVEEMFLPGEIKKLGDAITELSGVEEGQENQQSVDEEIKN